MSTPCPHRQPSGSSSRSSSCRGGGDTSAEPAIDIPPVVQDMEIQPTPVNVGATTSVAGADKGKSCEDDGTSPSLPASESHVVVPKDTTSRQEAKVEKKPSKQSIPFTKRGQAKARSGRRKTRRSRSRSPIKDRRRDKSPWGTELSTDESSSDVDDFSFDSDLAATLTHETITPENLPLPEGDDGNLLDPQKDNSNTDTPLTQFTPNLPCATQERQQLVPEPEDSQASEETRGMTRFFSKKSLPFLVKGMQFKPLS